MPKVTELPFLVPLFSQWSVVSGQWLVVSG